MYGVAGVYVSSGDEKNYRVMRVRVAGVYVTPWAEKNDRVMRVRVAGIYVTSGERKMIELCVFALQGFM